MLSSVGAGSDAGTGPVQGVHRVEEIIRQLSNVNVTILRSGFLYVNFLRDIPLIKNRNVFGNNKGGDVQLALTHPEDLAKAAADELQAKGDGFEIKYIVSEVSKGNQIALLFGQAIGKPNLTRTNIPDEQLKHGMLSGGVPPKLAHLITELGQGVRTGIVTKDFLATGAKVIVQMKLEQFAEQFKAKYLQD